MQKSEAQICFAAVRVKHWVLRHYLWFALTVLLLALATGFHLNLKHRDYGWLKAQGVRRKLEKIAANWQGPPPMPGVRSN